MVAQVEHGRAISINCVSDEKPADRFCPIVIVNRKADTFSAPQLLVDLIQRFAGLRYRRLRRSREMHDLDWSKWASSKETPLAGNASHIKNIGNALPAVDINLS
jgi:hypothetical protein